MPTERKCPSRRRRATTRAAAPCRRSSVAVSSQRMASVARRSVRSRVFSMQRVLVADRFHHMADDDRRVVLAAGVAGEGGAEIAEPGA